MKLVAKKHLGILRALAIALVFLLSTACEQPGNSGGGSAGGLNLGPGFYVRAGESGDGSLASPWGSVQTAIDSVTPPTNIYVSAGTYNESVSPREGVSLYGGFKADLISEAEVFTAVQEKSGRGGSGR